MKKFLLILFCALMLRPVSLPAQNSTSVPVEISKDKIRINGAVYYVHLVKQGQTLYSISKAYNVPISDLEENNPMAKGGLKAGAFIYIPVSSAGSVPVEQVSKPVTTEQPAAPPTKVQEVQEENEEQETSAEEYKYRRNSSRKESNKKPKKEVSEGQYKYRRGAAYAEATETAVITTATAAAATTVATGVAATTSEATEMTDNFAEPEATAAKQEANAAESSPLPPVSEVSPYTASSDNVTETTSATLTTDLYDKWNQTYRISLILPFGKSAPTGKSDVNHTDFYSGFLLGLHDLKKEEEHYRKYTLEVFDLDHWDSPQQMISQSHLEGSDLIIGPITPKDVMPLAAFAKENKIPIVSPMDIRTSSLADENPYLFIYSAAVESSQGRIMDRFAEDSDDKTLIVISERGKEGSTLVSNTFKYLDSIGCKYVKYSYAILQNKTVNRDIMSLIPADNTPQARIFVASENEAFVADALRNLNILVTNNNRNIAVFGLPKWRNFGSVQLEYFHHLNTHLSLSYYIDYNSPETMAMTERFEDVFHTSPSPFAYQGYDIATFFIKALEQYGPTFPLRIMDNDYKTIQSDIRFVQKCSGGGFSNTAVRDITYLPDWTIVEE